VASAAGLSGARLGLPPVRWRLTVFIFDKSVFP